MASGQRRLAVVLLLFFLVASSSTAVPITRSLKIAKSQVSVGNEVYSDQVVEGRIILELADYGQPGANKRNDPTPPSNV